MHTKALLPDVAHIGRIRLAVSDLSQSLSYYTEVLGLSVQSRSAGLAALTAHGSREVLIELQEMAEITPLAQRSRLGLYHFALLLPSRGSLASFVEHLVESHIRFGASDHGVSEALYLTDPDGIQIEVYADCPRSNWPFIQGELQMSTEPLHFNNLLAVPHDPWSGDPADTRMGHVHFFVGDLQQARKFYCDALGFDVMLSSYPGALFVSAGGYHHHVGLNTWAKGAPVANATDPRLLSWELVLENETQVAEATRRVETAGFPGLVDPWRNKLVLTTRAHAEG